MLTAAFAPLYFTSLKGCFSEFINLRHSCFEEKFQKPSVHSWVVGVTLFPNISWHEIHKLSNCYHTLDLSNTIKGLVLPTEGHQPIRVKMT